MSNPGLVAFDLDGTLVRIWSAWSWIHKFLGTLDAAKSYAELYHAGEIDYTRWAELDVELWHGVSLRHIKNAIKEELIIIPNAKSLIDALHKLGLKTAIISSGLKVFADLTQESLGIDISRANELITDKEGKICGVEVHVAYDNKDQILKEIAQESKVTLRQCAAIGDSRNDVPMFQISGFSIAFNPTSKDVAQAATTTIISEDALDLLPPLRNYFQLD